MKRLRSAAVLLSFLLASPVFLTACASGSGGNPFDQPAAGENEVRITVRNQNFNDATVRALWSGGYRERLGAVTGNSSRTFTARYRSESLRFEVDFLAGGGYTTGTVGVSPGEHLEITLRP